MPRPRTVPKVNWKVYLPLDLAGEIDLLLFDAFRCKTAYGARSAYIEQLVREDLARRKAKREVTEV